MAITSVSGATTTTTAGADLTGALGKEDFLKLLLTQLSNQDPLDPLDNNEFIAQMTQFSSLEQLQGINGNIETSLLLDQSLNNALSTSLIGREVTVTGNAVYVESGAVRQGGFAATEAGTAAIAIRDSSGAVVRTITRDVDEAGYVAFDWDGLDETGAKVADGDYTVTVTFTDGSGADSAVSLYQTGTVAAVKFLNGNAYLEVDGREYNLSQVIEVRNR